MESDEEVRAHLREADRAAAAPWTDFPPTPRWYPPAVGAWTALVAVTLGQGRAHPAAAVAGLVVLVIIEYGFVVWYRRYRGAMPGNRPPREFHQPIARLVLGVAAITAVAWLGWHFIHPAVAVGATFALMTALIGWYEGQYAAAAKAVKARLQ
jgi:hypothetical protein